MHAWYWVSLPPRRAATVETPTSARQVVLARARVRCWTGSGDGVEPPEPVLEPPPVMSPTAPPTASPRLETASLPGLDPPEPPEPAGVPGSAPPESAVSPELPELPELPVPECCASACCCLALRTLACLWALAMA